MHLISRITNVVAAFIIAVFSVNILTVMDVHAAQNGNNGTLKVHEKGTPSGTESNDPKVCAFNFEGFGFDKNQSGYVVIATQPGGASMLTLPFGPTSNSGYAASVYINDGGLSIVDGQYKATLYGKDTANPSLPNLNDEKAKSKVFKVQCPAKPTVTVQAGSCIQPNATNGTVSGTVYNTNDATNDTVVYTITATHQVLPIVKSTTKSVGDGQSGNFSFSGLAAGTYNLTVTGNDGTSTTPTTFDIAKCNILVTATAPTKADICGVANDTYTIPAKTGVAYLVNGIEKAAGTYAGMGTIVVTAIAQPGYELQGTASWTITFNSTPCIIHVTPPAPTKTDLCGTDKDTITIPAKTGVVYKINGAITAAGTYAASGVTIVTAIAESGYDLDGTQLWVFAFSTTPCDIIVTPAAPTKADVCGRSNDTFTIPATKGVTYFVNGWPLPAGTYDAHVPILIVAVANYGYDLADQAQSVWLFGYTNVKCAEPCHQLITMKFIGNHTHWDGEEPCIPVAVAAADPSSVDLCGIANDTYTIPAKTGVVYKVNGVITPAGIYSATAPVTITAEAMAGYTLAQGVSTWNVGFTDVACPKPILTVAAECSATGVLVTIKNDGDGDGIVYVNGDLVEVPAMTAVETTASFATLFKTEVVVTDQNNTVLFDQDFDCTPGRGATSTALPATPVTPATTMPAELPTTGTGTIAQLMIMVILAITTYGATYFLQGRLDLASKK